MLIAARPAALAAFTASKAVQDARQYSPKAWLVAQTRVTRAAAGASVAWMRRLAKHRALRPASWPPGNFRFVGASSVRLDRPAAAASRDAADQILLSAILESLGHEAGTGGPAHPAQRHQDALWANYSAGSEQVL